MSIKRVKKFIIWVLVVLLISIGAMVYIADFALREVSLEVAKSIQTRGRSLGVSLQNIHFEDSKINYFRNLEWQNITAEGKLSERFGFDANVVYQLFIRKAVVRFSAISKGVFSLSVDNLAVSPSGYMSQTGNINYANIPQLAQASKIKVDELKLHFNLGSYSRRSIIEGIKRELSALLDIINVGETTSDIRLRGRIEFNLDSTQVRSEFRVVKRGDIYRLVIDEDSVRKIARKFSSDLTSSEIKLIAEYPRRVSKLLLIKEYAETRAKELRVKESVPEDAYKHLLWSYKLTKAFGEEFAKLVTDAHEKGDYSDSTSEHEMDYNNNALGREYALKGVEEKELELLVFKDPRVIKAPQ